MKKNENGIKTIEEKIAYLEVLKEYLTEVDRSIGYCMKEKISEETGEVIGYEEPTEDHYCYDRFNALKKLKSDLEKLINV